MGLGQQVVKMIKNSKRFRLSGIFCTCHAYPQALPGGRGTKRTAKVLQNPRLYLGLFFPEALSPSTSRNTQRSKSSKNRRKHEKKKYSTREGSSFEDIGLIAAQHEVISTVYGVVEDVGLGWVFKSIPVYFSKSNSKNVLHTNLGTHGE